MLLKFVHEKQSDPDDRHERAPQESARWAVAEECPGQQSAGDQEQSENDRDHAGRDVPLSEVDCVEVYAELREAEEQGGQQGFPPERQLLAFPFCDERHAP